MDVTPVSPDCLSGIRVLDLTGADIAKVENPKGGEAGRTGFGDAYYFMMYNANKRSITVNLKSERGLALVKEMVKKADVFTENFAPAPSSASDSATKSSARSIRASSMPRSRGLATAALTRRACRSTRSRRPRAAR
jgi:hypothetical protein